jgi:tetratricopeptide (TPR) repeat protein
MSSTETFLRRLTPYLVAALVLAVIAAVFSFRRLYPTVDFEVPERGRVVVLPIQNLTGESEQAWVDLALMEMIAETLVRTQGIEVIAPKRLVELVLTRGLLAGTGEDAGTRERIRELAFEMGAELAFDISLRRRDGQYVFQLAAVDRRGTAVATAEIEGQEPMAVAPRLTQLAAESLSGRVAPVRMERAYSPSPFLNRLFGMGLAELYQTGPKAARPYFEIVLATRPAFLAARLKLSECDRLEGRTGAAREASLLALKEAQDRGERLWSERLLRQLSRLEGLEGRSERAWKLAEQALVLAEGEGDSAARLDILRDLSRLALAAGERAQAMEFYDQVLALEGELGDRLGRTDTLVEVATAALRAGELEEAESRLEEARSLADELGDLRGQFRALSSLGEVYSLRGERDAAVDAWSRAFDFYKQRGEHRQQLVLKRNVAETLLLEDKLEDAEEAFQDLRELAVEIADRRLEALASMRLTWILLRRGYPYLARNHLERALELEEHLANRLTLQRLIAWVAYEDGHYRVAVDTLVAAKRQAGMSWGQEDEEYLVAFVAARESGERQALPGEDRRR